MTTHTTTPVLETRELSVQFGGHVAVNRVSCRFDSGTLTAIVGPNGAGKTTYFNLISGQLPATEGEVRLRGRVLGGRSAAHRARAGLGRAFQLTQLFPRLSVADNLRLVVQAKLGLGFRFWQPASHLIAVDREVEALLERVDLAGRAEVPASQLSHGGQRRLEVGMMLALDPEVMMFDEPTAGMSLDEAPVVLNLIRSIKEAGEKTILLVEHKMDVIRSLADRIIVLNNGTLLADGEPAEVMSLPSVRQAYLGESGEGAT
ncbi:ABC transporter ATP-binding protein [Saccharospirillum salsuginis]|uniref:ABC transporter ATP-binding protein n=1 Tax=Saccharospirillum salsuginis TaxID=418750 RepID=A0A918NGD6_9GAMM|nr:ABC transporter ATP-binding protein [Saccharospirillum salsuginis]GGX65504.1 ABC transporter ATP-binding protein [Saccharospirillum salsuginis]